jgi:microcystin-dependent protein
MDENYLAELRLFAGNFAPTGWAFCNGQLLSISQNTALFSLLGTNYGGDGRTNFALPNLQGRVAVGAGQGSGLSLYDLGQQDGSETVTLTNNNLPAHSHTISGTITPKVTATAGNTDTPYNTYPAMLTGTNMYNSAKDAGSTIAMQNNLVTASTGNGNTVNLMQPVLGLTWIIALQGIFPPRS